MMFNRAGFCRTCDWYRGGLRGVCTHPLVEKVEGHHEPKRWAGSCCAVWTKRQEPEEQKHEEKLPTELTDDDLAEFERKIRRIVKECKR